MKLRTLWKSIAVQPILLGTVRPIGTIKSPNLTPDANNLPGGLTYEQFLTTIRTGIDHEPPHNRLIVMPWASYRFMTDRDLSAIYEYLKAIPHAEPGSCRAVGQ